MPDHAWHQANAQAHAQAKEADTRQRVTFPDALCDHTLANMRDHLSALGELQDALDPGRFNTAVELAEQRVGMSSLMQHGAREVARFMPQGMQGAGTTMHRTASQLATIAKDASVTSDLRPAPTALARLNKSRVACHAGYRLH
jgi:hypothetical protein